MPARKMKMKAPSVSLSVKAGLNFPVGRLLTALKKRSRCKRVSERTAVVLAAALQYMTTELLCLATKRAEELKKKRIVPSTIRDVVRTDDDLRKLLKNVILPGCGLQPSVHV
eukprot:Rhum_TRINITY_DN588_c0_g1::Rhum_TRINITY_DN588_c0_g1_i1::g.1629::m.1629/K11251/H2A; histone H2A